MDVKVSKRCKTFIFISLIVSVIHFCLVTFGPFPVRLILSIPEFAFMSIVSADLWFYYENILRIFISLLCGPLPACFLMWLFTDETKKKEKESL